jgi:hypothetical protein
MVVRRQIAFSEELDMFLFGTIFCYLMKQKSGFEQDFIQNRPGYGIGETIVRDFGIGTPYYPPPQS